MLKNGHWALPILSGVYLIIGQTDTGYGWFVRWGGDDDASRRTVVFYVPRWWAEPGPLARPPCIPPGQACGSQGGGEDCSAMSVVVLADCQGCPAAVGGSGARETDRMMHDAPGVRVDARSAVVHGRWLAPDLVSLRGYHGCRNRACATHLHRLRARRDSRMDVDRQPIGLPSEPHHKRRLRSEVGLQNGLFCIGLRVHSAGA
jgi:hypothetical protein